MSTLYIVLLLIAALSGIWPVFLQAQSFSKKYNAAENLIHWPPQFDPAQSRFYVHNWIDISAPPERVWQLLIQATQWPAWYDGIMDIRFKESNTEVLTLGTKVFWRSMGQNLNNTVVEYVPNERLAWQFNESAIQGHHAWLIIPTETGCTVITDESQNGRLAGLQKIFLPKKLMKQHDKWLRLLKQQAELKTSTGKAQLSTHERTQMQDMLQTSYSLLMAAVDGLSDSQLAFKSKPDAWSIAECIEHLALSEIQFPEILKAQLKSGSGTYGKVKLKYNDVELRNRMISTSWKAKAPENLEPRFSFNSPELALSTFATQRLATIQYVLQTGDDLRSYYWRHPLTGTIDLYQTLILMSAHVERHTMQIRKIKAHHSFP